MFDRSAELYDALYAFKDYGEAAEALRDLIGRRAPSARTLLDVACGTGLHAQHLKRWFAVEGLDINPTLLRAARERCPDVTFHEADMTGFDLGRRFDVVTCLFSSIAYVRTVAGLEAAVRSMAGHLDPGGLLIVEPWFEPDAFRTGTITSNRASRPPDLEIAWQYTSERDEDRSVLDMHFLVGRPSGIEHFRERHELGLFTREQHMAAFSAAGLEAEFEPDSPFQRGFYAAWLRAS